MTLASIIIPTFNRSKLLVIGLNSLRSQVTDIPHEIIVVNDGPEDDTEAICDRFGAHFHFTGQRNTPTPKPRVPGFAINYALRRARGEFIVLTCPEVWHVGQNVLNAVLEPLLAKKHLLSTPLVIDDTDGTLSHFISHGSFDREFALKWWDSKYTSGALPFLANKYMPYFMGLHRSDFEMVGGYDEDFTGIGADDNDLVDRLLANGCEYHFPKAEVVHLFHGPKIIDVKDPCYLFNVKLWKERQGQVVRNQNRRWGQG